MSQIKYRPLTATSLSKEEQSEDDWEPISTVSSLPDRQTISLSLRATYTKWNPREAFREIVQNWLAIRMFVPSLCSLLTTTAIA